MKSHLTIDVDSLLKELEAERVEREKEAVILNIHGVKISEDYGKTWTTKALCTECIKEIEPPTMAKRECLAGVRFCDWCGALNASGRLNNVTLEAMALKRSLKRLVKDSERSSTQ